jgi:hypothetical protein
MKNNLTQNRMDLTVTKEVLTNTPIPPTTTNLQDVHMNSPANRSYALTIMNHQEDLMMTPPDVSMSSVGDTGEDIVVINIKDLIHFEVFE